ncbi:MAG: phosphatidate cytidylyltransferase [Myxococcales bacterium]|nr:phosphatidate cytidylyltransferase [Myxococcales bacterium]
MSEPVPPAGDVAGRKSLLRCWCPDGELRARLLTASILVPAVLFVVYMGGLWMLAALVVLTVLAQREFYGLIEDKGAHPIEGFGLAAGAALPVVAYLGNEYHATVLMTATLLTVMLAQLGRRQISEALASISGTFFGVFYVGWLLAHVVVLRQFYEQVVSRAGKEQAAALGFAPQSGAFLLLFALAVVVLCDAGAYFAGRAYGKRKLAPRVSPGKTVEGTAGGVLAGTCGGLVAKGIFELLWPELSAGLSWTAAVVFGIAVSALAVVGDLIESLLKRDAQVKDAGSVLPGMGGILDRIDSPLLGIPGMYYMMLFYVFLQVN